jgi:hypothetical protein
MAERLRKDLTQMIFAQSVVILLGTYAGIGLLFAFAFLTSGIDRIDPASQGTGIGFRLIIVPGVVSLWPMLLLRWIRKGRAT